MKLTPTEWLFQQLWDMPKDKLNWYAALKKAKKMECDDWNKGEQLDPKVITDPIVEQLKAKLTTRSEVGIRKYNTTLHANNMDNFLQHAQEEAMDLALYLEKLQTINKSVYNLIRFYSNDQELGKAVRSFFI